MRKQVAITVLLTILATGVWAAPATERLLFMGEDTDVVTIASGKPELPEKSPAVVKLVSSRDTKSFQFRTLKETLNSIPGFFSEPANPHGALYFRGIKSGVLMLYDGVPLTTDTTKAIYPLREELSLDYLKKVEVVRGPASVLWGPDAFSGVVNLVPKEGKDINGIRIKFETSSPDKGREASILLGGDTGTWDIMAFGKYKYSKGFLGNMNQECIEAAAKVTYTDILSISFRASGIRRPYVSRYGGTYWTSRWDTPFSTVKLEYHKRFRHASFKIKTAYTRWNISRREGEYNWSYRDDTYILEALINRELFQKSGMLTVGAGLRQNRAHDAVIAITGDIRDYIRSGFPIEPITKRESFDTTLTSVFAQYIHHFRKTMLWAGVRIDKHSDYRSTFSYTAGAAFYPHKEWTLKLSTGTAYRTPYAEQFLKERISPERISSTNLQIQWHPVESLALESVAFYNRITHHIGENLYAGLSEPTSYDTKGLELSAIWKGNRIKAWASATVVGVSESREKYRVLDYIIITPSSLEYHYHHIATGIDAGPRFFTSFGISSRLQKYMEAGFEVFHYTAYTGETASPMVHGFLRFRKNNWSISIKGENLFNKQASGRAEGFKLFISAEVRF